jgi:hypothetical protein
MAPTLRNPGTPSRGTGHRGLFRWHVVSATRRRDSYQIRVQPEKRIRGAWLRLIMRANQMPPARAWCNTVATSANTQANKNLRMTHSLFRSSANQAITSGVQGGVTHVTECRGFSPFFGSHPFVGRSYITSVITPVPIRCPENESGRVEFPRLHGKTFG